jgi:hypothetical protein
MENRSAAEFLGLNDEEAAIVELKLPLANAVKQKRVRRGLTQGQLGGYSERVYPEWRKLKQRIHQSASTSWFVLS